MNTPCKILAMAWMALRPFSTNVHADTINWEEVSHFFNFDTIVEEEKRTHLETNIQLLVEEQLKLPSGQNLWKAFQFWENQHPELGFQFEFRLIDESEAYIVLKKYEDWSQTFRFEITCNEIFAENHRIPHWHKISCDLESNLALKRFLNVEMLYRPCLLKLVNPDNPEKWNYHLREQKLPFFITLAHEFLHALNQLECIDWLIEKNESFSNPKSRLQDFLMEKLELKPDDNVLQEKYKIFWENPNFDDSLDEMTVILGTKRLISLSKKVFIGETTFLREYYKDKSIISWSHCSARDLEFWQKMPMVLEKNYVKAVDEKFNLGNLNIRTYHALNLKKDKILKEYTDFFDAKRCLHETSFDVNDAIKNFQNKKFFVGSNKGGVVKVENFEVLKTDTFNIHLLPQYSKFILLNDYKCVSTNTENDIDLLKIENSFYAKNNFNLVLNDSILQYLERISKNTLTNILIIIDYDIIKYQYWIITEDICKRSITGNIEAILNEYSTAEKFYYNGFCFQKIINKK